VGHGLGVGTSVGSVVGVSVGGLVPSRHTSYRLQSAT